MMPSCLTLLVVSLSAALLLCSCAPPISGVPEDGCALSAQSVCLCPQGNYVRLECASDGSIYCPCSTQTRFTTPPGLDASPDLDNPLVDMAQDTPDGAADLDEACGPSGCVPRACEVLLKEGALMPSWTQDTPGFLAEDLPVARGYEHGRLCMQAAGLDVWSTSDRFFYVSKPSSGEFDLSVKVESLEGTQDYTKLGIMFRTSSEVDSAFVMLQLSRVQGASMLARDRRGARATLATPYLAAAAPYWLRLIRLADTFFGYVSSDGVTWQPVTAYDASGISRTGRLGFSLSSHNAEKLATASLSDITERVLEAQSEDCPADIACEEVDTYRGIDLATRGGLDPRKFMGSQVETLSVTRADGQSVGTLHDALNKANARAKLGLYTIIDVDTTQVTTPIGISPSGSPRASRLWIRGHGATVYSLAPPGSGTAMLKLDEQVIIEGFRFRDSGTHVLAMDTEGGPSSKRRSGIWIHHNSFDECALSCISLVPTLRNETRHITISHNTFGAQSENDIAAIFARNTCIPSDPSCRLHETNLWLSVHHNIFADQVRADYPTGGMTLFYYNNFISALRPPGLDTPDTGVVLSRLNIYSTADDTEQVSVFNGNATIDNQGDFFERGARQSISYDAVPNLLFPDYFAFYYLSRDVLLTQLMRQAGPPVLP